jgi:hypothetical protein
MEEWRNGGMEDWRNGGLEDQSGIRFHFWQNSATPPLQLSITSPLQQYRLEL